MKITTVLFDLDGTLLPMDQDIFIHAYSSGLVKTACALGYDKDVISKALWVGIGAMIKNNGELTNEEVFNKAFSSVSGIDEGDISKHFDNYYVYDFPNVQKSCGYNENAAKAVRKIKNMGFRTVLATNPFFPSTATEQRISWTGLSPSDFELYTTYESSHYCKPNLDYYREVMNKLGVTSEECLMVGNDVGEDMIAENLGCKVFLLTDCLINKDNKDISVYPNGSFSELLQFIDTL